MTELYTGLKARAVAKDTTTRFKHISRWNNQLQRMKDGEELSFRLPALFFEFVSPQEIQSVGGGVQVTDPLLVKIHVLSEFYNDSATGTSINLDAYEIHKLVHPWFQGYALRGADYGCSELNRIGIEEDDDHDKVYHHQATYQTTWVDNSTKYPTGGYEIEPSVSAELTVEALPATVAEIVVSGGSLNFGSITTGAYVELSFTISGVYLKDHIRISSSDSTFTLKQFTTYSSFIDLPEINGEVETTTITVKFRPMTPGVHTAHLNYGSPGINGQIDLTGTGL